jgi:hypothetical protein
MKENEPQMEPGEISESVANQGEDVSVPSEMPPPSAEEAVSAVGPAPTMEGMGDMAPSLPVEEGAIAGVAAWQNNKRVTALWSINQNCNSWAGISGMGWKKLANNSVSAVVALTMLCSHAREKNSAVNFREEGGMVREIYVW